MSDDATIAPQATASVRPGHEPRPPLLPHQRRRRLAMAAGLLAILVIVGLAPSASNGGLKLWPPCVMKEMTGVPCPLCGGTRAARALMHGDFQRTLTLNVLAFPAVAGMFLVALVLGLEAIWGRTFADWRRHSAKFQTLIPLGLVFLLLWWFPHAAIAFRTANSELVDLSNPVARGIHQIFFNKAK